uniref:SAP domain-containing protein n=1 Tax=Amphimedon queenslandica TaxID=400682 RepID=A0A1X7UMM2_AMPQE
MSSNTKSGVTDLKRLKLQDLKQVAKQLSVETKGNKNDLVLRLEKCDETALSRVITALKAPSNVSDLLNQNNQPPQPSLPLCPICEKRFTHGTGEESIQCEGECQAWLHRCCAGLSKLEYDHLSCSPVPFCCAKCRLLRAEEKISTLQSQVAELFNKLHTQLQSASSSALPNDANDRPSGSSSASTQSSRTRLSSSGGSSASSQSSRTRLSMNHFSRKFNLVFHNIPELVAGTSFTDRLKHDFDAVSAAIDTSIAPNIQDCVRLGRFRDGARNPRPVLAKFSDTRSVLAVLAQPPQSGVVVKRDLSKEDRQISSVLLKERYRLVSENNVVKRSVKFRGSKLFINGRIHGSVRSGVFIQAPANTHNTSTPSEDNLTTGSLSDSVIPEDEPTPSTSSEEESTPSSGQSSQSSDD